MRVFVTLVGLYLAVLLPQTAHCYRAPQYGTFRWNEAVRPRELAADAIRSRIYPEWNSGTIDAFSVAAESPWQGMPGIETRWLNLETTRHCHLTLLHYSADGSSYVIRELQPLPAAQELTLSIHLSEAALPGTLRVIAWRSEPHASWIELLARHPNYEDEPLPGIYEQRWMPLEAGQPGDPFISRKWDMHEFVPLLEPWHFDPWPVLSAKLDSSFGILTKDCAVYYRGIEATKWLDGDLRTAWQVNWSNDLRLVFELPGDYGPQDAELRIYGAVTGQSPITIPTEAFRSVEATINGARLDLLTADDLFGSAMQPMSAELSQYLQPGNNELVLRSSPLVDTEWLISGIDLWAR